MPTNEELLADLTTYGEKRPPPVEVKHVSRRTRDYVLTAVVGSAGIALLAVKLAGNSDPGAVARLAFTGIALFCGLLGYVFFSVMSRY